MVLAWFNKGQFEHVLRQLGDLLVARHDLLLNYDVLLQLIAYEVVWEFAMDLLQGDVILESHIKVGLEEWLADLQARKVQSAQFIVLD